MESTGLSATELRVIIAVIGAIVFGLIYLFGRPKKPGQGRRMPTLRGDAGGERIEPTLGTADEAGGSEQGSLDVGMREELERLGSEIVAKREGAGSDAPKRPMAGARPDQPIERIVTLFVAARAGDLIHGPDLVVAAEKAGLAFGDMGIFHRLVDGRRELGPIFSVANLVKPGNFDLKRVEAMQTPGLSFFMTLPGPVPALDAWDTMLPAAQRLAELLDGLVLDEERNALGRQRIAHIRDELRGWDRGHEGVEIKFGA